MGILQKNENGLFYSINQFGVKCIREIIKPAVYDLLNKRETKFVQTIWQTYGGNDKLLGYFDLTNLSFSAWRNFPKRFWLTYLQCLVERGDSQKTRQVLDKYFFYKGNSLEGFEKFLLLSNFINSNGLTNEKIKRASFIYDKLKKARQDDVLKKILSDKLIAVVGNGPSEIGKKKGREIDSHDIVIRFNNFTTSSHVDDYGTKTDIWCRGAGADVKDRPDQFKLVTWVWEADCDHWEVPNEHQEIMYRQIQKGQEIYDFDFDCHMSFRTATGIDAPTTGAILIWELYRKRGNFKNVDFYGFNFCAEKFDSYATHYFESRSIKEAKNRSSRHDFIGEAKFFSNLIYGRKTIY